ncbi:tight adherence protein C [Litoreibacter ascidiaceicola]|uniref:Tight adherence protein C n=1 Tax=Litoreibacter ascidiaceicola TaxID=1486859 RepID=A0A1M4Y837_9RHOB|nr:type II secretion system F family protein [Litoreibacter ascidiaceicola]SHF01931.1 tight adherence protein C [Litoreibacter ascidiaceicola]
MQFIEKINALLVDNFGELGPLMAVGLLGFIMVLVTLPTMLKKQKDPLDRIREEAQRSNNRSKNGENSLRNANGTDKLDKFANFLEPQDDEELAGMKLKLLQAGYKQKTAVRTFHFAQFALGLLFLTLGLLYVLILGGDDMSTRDLILAIVIPGGAGYYLPKYWIERRRQERQDEIESGFPDSLDLMLVCVEAGQALDQSIIRVAAEIRAGYPALADEFQMVANEMKAGKDRITVLRDMAERAGVPDVSSFVTVLIQSTSFGTSIADALRVYASEMRDKRVMRAEEKANVLPTKLTLGTMLFCLPPLLIILIGPSIYDIYKNLNGGGG